MVPNIYKIAYQAIHKLERPTCLFDGSAPVGLNHPVNEIPLPVVAAGITNPVELVKYPEFKERSEVPIAPETSSENAAPVKVASYLPKHEAKLAILDAILIPV